MYPQCYRNFGPKIFSFRHETLAFLFTKIQCSPGGNALFTQIIGSSAYEAAANWRFVLAF